MNQPLRPSGYVQRYELEDGHVLLANLLWQSYLELTGDEGEVWDAATTLDGCGDIDPELRQRLTDKRMLIGPEIDELALMDEVYTRRRFAGDILGLTIAPTIDCNFACPYCYENKRPGRMTPEVEKQLIEYVESYLPGRTALNVIWYGGEPLMCRESIARLTKAFLELCEAHHCRYKARMVTNGYLLTPEVADQLAAFGHWSTIQITLDGSASFHDVKRPLRSGRPTFQRVYENLVHAMDKLPIALRMNVDLLNPEGCHALIDMLARDGAAGRLQVYFAPIHAFGAGCRDIDDQPDVKLSTTAMFSTIQNELVRHAMRSGLATALPFETSYLPQCQATSTHSVVVEPDGSLQRCWVEVGDDDKRIGHISEPVDLTGANSLRWLKFHPVRSDPCRSCEVLPLCFGGCPQRHLEGAPESKLCNAIRYNTREMVLAEYLSKRDPAKASAALAVRAAQGPCAAAPLLVR